MIEFEHKLPSMNIAGRKNGTYNNYELGFPSILTTTDPNLGRDLQKPLARLYRRQDPRLHAQLDPRPRPRHEGNAPLGA